MRESLIGLDWSSTLKSRFVTKLQLKEADLPHLIHQELSQSIRFKVVNLLKFSQEHIDLKDS